MLEPATEAEVAEIVRRRQPLRPFGNGSKLHHGPAPAAGEPMSLRKLSAITMLEPGDLVAGAQAGTRLVDLQSELAKHNLWLPIDPPYAQSTIGGVLATNSSGPRRLGYGTMRDLVIGMRVVGGDGVVTRSGGKVVKNVTGYDLHKLHIGAFGTLGVVTEANLKVRPKPEVSAIAAFPCSTFVEAHNLLLGVSTSPLRPVALEVIDLPLPGLEQGKPWAVVGIEGTRPVLARHLRDLEKHYAAHPEVREGAEAQAIWDAFRDIPAAFKDMVRVRVGAKPHDLPGLLPPSSMWVRAGTGLAWTWFAPGPDLLPRLAAWQARAAAKGGYVVAESAPLDLPDREKLPWGAVSSPLQQGIRAARDPESILNRGRVFV